MKRFYERYKDADEKLRRSVALLPWKHNMLIIGKGLDDKASLYYAEEDIAKGWNRDMLLIVAIKTTVALTLNYDVLAYW